MDTAPLRRRTTPSLCTVQGRRCNCGSTEYSLRWRLALFKNTFPLLNPEFGTNDPDGSVFETWNIRMLRWRQTSLRGRQNNNRRDDSGNGRSRYTNNRGHNPTQGSTSVMSRAHASADARNFQPRSNAPHFIPQTHNTGIRQEPGPTDMSHANNQQHVPLYGQHSRNR